MKALDFERLLSDFGFVLSRNSKHRIWTNGKYSVAVPQGKIINKMVARRELKKIGYDKRVNELNYLI